jgi:hypothetical protein
MRKDGRAKARCGAFHSRVRTLAEYESLQYRILAAQAALTRDGVHPSNERIAKAAGIKGVDVGAITEILVGGTLAEIPDDPDAAEIQARIAEVRATKEASARPPLECARGRHHRPNCRPHSRQRIVA